MTAVKTMVGEKLLIQIGDGGTPEIFAHDCLINAERGIAMSADVTEVVVPDCDSPSDPAFKQIFKDGISLVISGGGLVHTTSLETWFNWMVSDTAKNIRVKFDVTGALGGGYIAFSGKLTAFNVTGPRKNNTTVEVTITSYGTATWTDNA